jgi:hypothetical protein
MEEEQHGKLRKVKLCEDSLAYFFPGGKMEMENGTSIAERSKVICRIIQPLNFHEELGQP